MQSEKKHLQKRHSHSWRLNVRAKSRTFNLNFRFRATSFGSNWTFHRVSLFLKLRNFFAFALISDRPTPIAQQSRLGFLRARVVASAIQKFRARITKKKSRSVSGKRGSIRIQPQVAIRDGFVVVWLLGFLAELMWKKELSRFVIIGCVGFSVALLKKKKKSGKFWNMMRLRGIWIVVIVLVILIACAVLLLCDFDRFLEAWNKICGLFLINV